MNWFIPENELDFPPRPVIDSVDIHSNNVCIKGFAKTGKTLLLIYLMRRIRISEPNATIHFIVIRNIEVEKYRNIFRELSLQVNVSTYFMFLRNPQRCDYAFCDDVQNISVSTLSTIANNANRVIVAMNPYMPIFDKGLLSQEPIITMEEIIELLSPTVRHLQCFHKGNIHYDLITNLIADTGLNYSRRNLSMSDCQPRICKADSEDSEMEYIIKQAKKTSNLGFSTAILLPTNMEVLKFVQRVIKMEGSEPWDEVSDKWGRIDFAQLNRYLSVKGIPLTCLGTETPDSINVINYYNSAVYEFDRVFIPFLNNKLYIHSNDIIARNLFVYAILSSRYSLYMTYSGHMHPYLTQIETYCGKIDISTPNQNQNNSFIEV